MIPTLVIAWLTIVLPWAVVLLRALELARAEGIGDMAELPPRYRARLVLQMIGMVCSAPVWGWICLRALSKVGGTEEFRTGMRVGWETARAKASRYQPIMPDPAPPLTSPAVTFELELELEPPVTLGCKICGESYPARGGHCSCRLPPCEVCGVSPILPERVDQHLEHAKAHLTRCWCEAPGRAPAPL